jgi:hypothetical protein
MVNPGYGIDTHRMGGEIRPGIIETDDLFGRSGIRAIPVFRYAAVDWVEIGYGITRPRR